MFCVSNITPNPATLADVLYFITDPAEIRTPVYDLSPADCPYLLVLTVTLIDDSPLPASITNTDPNISI